MKKIIFLFTICLFLISCETRQFNIRVCSGTGLNYTETWIQCDSFQMVTLTEAYIWVDGKKMKVIGSAGLRPETY